MAISTSSTERLFASKRTPTSKVTPTSEAIQAELPASERVAGGGWTANAWLIVGFAVVLFLYRDMLAWLWGTWSSDPDYSHGFFVPIFSAYLLWSTRSALRRETDATATSRSATGSGLAIGVGLVAVAILLRLAGIYMRIWTLETVSLLPFILGVLAIMLGRPAVRWGAPAVAFLLFMIPLPSAMSGMLGGMLQTVATTVSTFSLQTFGVPAFAEGNIISLSNGQIGVAEACSGLRMLYAFFALTTGVCLIIDRTWYEKIFIALATIPIAIAANCIRIIVTGLAFEYTDPDTAKHIFHDIGGWLMMPLGFSILMLMLAILDRLIVPEDRFPMPSS